MPEPTTAAAPRARGDGPDGVQDYARCELCSPRTRGWTHPLTEEGRPNELLPVHAGMDPTNDPSIPL